MSDVMRVSFPGGKRVHAHYREFEIETDQGRDGGGEGAAPEPFDLFLASLATCAGIYVLGFCHSRDIPADGISLEQSWERDDKGRLTWVGIRILVPESFPAKYHEALVRVAGKCAVKRTIEEPPEMTVETVVRNEK
jgi:putative redox protein